MAQRTYTDKELAAIVQEVRQEIGSLLKSESASLQKNADCAPEMVKDAPDSDESPAASPEASAPEASASPAPDASASASASPDASASASADPATDASAGADSFETLKQAYAQLSPEELAQHVEALKAVMMAQSGGAPAASPEASAPPAAAPSASPGPDASAPLAGEASKPLDPASTMALSEKSRVKPLGKSENEKVLEGKVEELEKSLGLVTKAFETILKKPVQKAITGKDVFVKNETEVDVSKLSKAEITKRLLKAAQSSTIEKSDRGLINNFYKGQVKLAEIAHLLK